MFLQSFVHIPEVITGLGGAALYPGSWSEWSSWPGAPIATGPG